MGSRTVTTTPSRKDIIFREAARLFREKGYNGSTLRGLASRSGVKGGSIYHHFSSKQEILYAIMEYTMTNLINRLQLAIKDEDEPLEKLRKAIIFHIEYHTGDMDETYVADAELRSLEDDNYRKIVQMRNDYEEIYRNILFEGKCAGKMHIENIKIASRAVLQMCTGISYWFDPCGEQSISEIAEGYVELFLWGACGKSSSSIKKGHQK
jgi:AcrR family transcriptional regulator